jgi:hypothetical protein
MKPPVRLARCTRRVFGVLLTVLLATAGGVAAQTATAAEEPLELEWPELIPKEWQPAQILSEYNIYELEDGDPRAFELYEKLQQLWAEAPVVEALDGKQVKLPGFVVPLEMDATQMSEFLLVPYFGACIHTPPPPANQTVYVRTGEGQAYRGEMFDVVWVVGTLRIERVASELGHAGYTLEAAQVSVYE